MQDNVIFSHILNLYDVLLLTTAVLSLVLAIPLWFKRDRQIQDVLLAAFVISQGFYAFYNVMLYNQFISPHIQALLYPFYKLPDMLVLGVQGPLLYWYACAMMGRRLVYRSVLTALAVGSTGISIAANIYAILTDSVEAYLLIFCGWVISVCAVIVGVKALHQLRGYETRLPFIHSNLTSHSLTWLRAIAIGFVVVWAIKSVAILLDVLGATTWAEGLYLFRHIPPLILMGIMVLYSQAHAVSGSANISLSDDLKQCGEHHPVNPALSQQLIDLMDRVKVYQDPELRLDGLADSLGISPRSLSSLLNNHHKKSFYDFVNDYRVRDAQQQLRCPDNNEKPIQRIFEDAGFNSKTTFNTLFKKYTGQTPSAFRKRAEHLQLGVNSV